MISGIVENVSKARGDKVEFIRFKLLLMTAIVFLAGAFGLTFLMAIEKAAAREAKRPATPTSFQVDHPVLAAVVSPPALPPLVYHSTAQPLPPAPKTGLATVSYRVPTNEPVIFITIDDGVTPNEAALKVVQDNRAVATLFLNDAAINQNYAYFKRWQAAGSTIQNHTIDHPLMIRLLFGAQKLEICGNADRFERVFGKRPTLFRPPYGEFNDFTRRAASECGQPNLVHWTASANNGLHYQVGDKLRPGDIVLLHFRPNLDKDLAVVFAAAKEQHLQIGRLEDWLR